MAKQSRSAYRRMMSGTDTDRVSISLTPDEAKLVIAALRQFEPYWPSDMDDSTRTDLLAGFRVAIDRVTTALVS
jgi:predicted DNA-binding transcriptional regulator YafY